MGRLSYSIETNGNNGVSVLYYKLDYTPTSVVWDTSNTFEENEDLPDPEDADNPEYVRRIENGEYAYYRRAISLPSKSSSFYIYVLMDGAVSEFSYEAYGSFLNLVMDGDGVFATSRTNVTGEDRNCNISVTSNINGEILQIPVMQAYDPVRLRLMTYEYENMDGDGEGTINDVTFEHTFHWLTKKTSPEKETLSVSVWASGPRNGYVISDISEFAFAGELNDSYVCTNGGYFQNVQSCVGGSLVMDTEEVVFDTQFQGVFKKRKYDNDLKITRNGNTIDITNYGRCFLQDDAYYIIELSNVDDLREKATIVIRYESEEP